MDLAVYISELLNERGTVTVPGLGILKQVRVASYYNDAEGKFYPPHYRASFEHEPLNIDQTLAQYISTKNKVSTGSARFFVNKYVADLLQMVEIQEVAIERLGWLYKQGNQLLFRPDTGPAVASAAYGFDVINLRKDATPVQPAAPAPAPVKPVQNVTPPAAPVEVKPAVISQPQPIVPAAVTSPQPVPPAHTVAPPSAPAINVEYKPEAVTPEAITSKTDESPEAAHQTVAANTSAWNAGRWVVMLIIAAIIAVGSIAIYKSLVAEQQEHKAASTEPDAAPESTTNSGTADTVVINNTPAVTDTDANATPATDSATQVQPVPAGADQQQAAAVKVPAMPPLTNSLNYKFTLLGGAYSTTEQANAVVEQYKAKGINAAVIINPPSKLYKVTFGYFKTFAEGQQAKVNLVQSKQLQSSKLYVETIRKNPKK